MTVYETISMINQNLMLIAQASTEMITAVSAIIVASYILGRQISLMIILTVLTVSALWIGPILGGIFNIMRQNIFFVSTLSGDELNAHVHGAYYAHITETTAVVFLAAHSLIYVAAIGFMFYSRHYGK